MPAWFEAFEVVATEAAEEEAAAALAEEAAASAAAEEAAAAQAANAANTAASANSLANLGISQVPQGAAAQITPAIESATAVGGQGAGTAEVQSAMQGAMEKAPLELGSEAPAGLNQVPPANQLASVNTGTMTDFGGSPEGEIFNKFSAKTAPDVSGYDRVNSLMDSAKMDSITQTAPKAVPELTNEQFYEKLAADPGSTANVPQGTQGPGMWDKFEAFADKHPFMTGAALYTGAYNMGLLDQRGGNEVPGSHYDGPLSKYRMSPNFKGSSATPNVYTPSYKQYAEGGVLSVGGPTSEVSQPRNVVNPMATVGDMNSGGIAGYAEGGVARYSKGNLTQTLDLYNQMIEGKRDAPSFSGKSDPGAQYAGDIYYDMDPDTRYQDALTAAQIRQAKLNKRTNMQMPSASVMKRPTPMGSLNLRAPGVSAEQSQSSLDPENAAHGGIMQVGGRYAVGGVAANKKQDDPTVSEVLDTTVSGGTAPAPAASTNGSPTGSVIGDIGYAVANQSISPIAAAITQGLMDALSPTSPTSVNAVNGMDAQSDAAAAAAAAAADGTPGGGSDGGGGGGFGSETGPGGIGEGGPGDGAPGAGTGGGGGDGASGEAHGGLLSVHRMAMGGIPMAQYGLGGYAAGGNPRLLKGPGDGMSDNIPATIAGKKPARLADGEFVVPADVVSHLGNGSTDAGAKKLHQMMTEVRKARTGNPKQGKQINPRKYMPK